MIPNDSPLWPLLKMTVILICAIVGVSVGYDQGFVARADLPVILGILLPYIGIELTQRISAPKQP